jgi:hypothetical protein
MHLYLLRAFQHYQEHGKRHDGLGDFNMTKKIKKLKLKLKKNPSYINREIETCY